MGEVRFWGVVKMFGFGKNSKRVALIKELVETRLRLRGQDDVQGRLFVKSLGTFNSMSLPEGNIVTIIEAAVAGQKKGALLKDVLMRQEAFRRMGGADADVFQSILRMSVGPNPAEALLQYIAYRIDLESRKTPNFFISTDELMILIPIAYEEIIGW